MVTAAELLPPSRGTDLVRDRIAVLRALVEDVLEVARLDAAVEVADNCRISTAELGRRCAQAAGDDAELRVLNDVQVSTDPRRVERIVANLVTNRKTHGRPPIVITVDGPVVQVRDHGPGYPPDLLDAGPRRFHTVTQARGQGHGLGLTIATGQASVLGASLTFDNPDGGGALASLRLPERPLTRS